MNTITSKEIDSFCDKTFCVQGGTFDDKNLKKIKGGEGGAISDENKTGDLTTTIIQDGRQSTGLC